MVCQSAAPQESFGTLCQIAKRQRLGIRSKKAGTSVGASFFAWACDPGGALLRPVVLCRFFQKELDYAWPRDSFSSVRDARSISSERVRVGPEPLG